MQQSEEDLRELATYLSNIKSFERDHIRSENSTIGMIWGLFIIIGGLLDGYVSVLTKYSPHAEVWFVIIASAIAAQQIISSQPLLYEKEFLNDLPRSKVTRIELVYITIAMVLTIPISMVGVEFVMPYVGLSFGGMNLFILKKGGIDIRTYKGLTASSYIISAVINILGLILVHDFFYMTSGLNFGVIVGSISFFSSYQQRVSVST